MIESKEAKTRTKIICAKCGKERILSYLEADEDGWQCIREGLACPKCIDNFGLPLDGPPRPTTADLIEYQRLKRFASKIHYI